MQSKSENMENMRGKMQQLWESVASGEATVAQMVLYPNAAALSKLEIPELLSLLPDIEKKDILELGAGIGRFTEQFAKKAHSVTCVDFLPSVLALNRKAHSDCGNISFIDADVTKLDQPDHSYDLIFSNGLFMYMSDTEVHSLFTKALSWLRPGGFLFFRETCFKAHDKTTVSNSAIQYRRPEFYSSVNQCILVDDSTFEIVLSKSVQAFVKMLSTSNEICWLLQKVPATSTHGFKTFQEFLDNKQYSRNSILRYERMFDKHFVSTGGLETTEEFVKLLKLKPGEHVLDVGAGIGGGDFYMAEKHDVFVTAMDLSTNMISIAQEKANEINDPRVQFEVCDATKCKYAAEAFDVIYSRDTILHISDKRDLFAKFLSWLKPGGRLLISDYCCTAGVWSQQYKNYVAQRGYHLLSVDVYGKLLEEVGFVNVRAEDRTELFVRMLKKEVKRLTDIQEEFVKEFSSTDYDELVNGWNNKIQRCALGDQKWGLFYAEKPTAASSK